MEKQIEYDGIILDIIFDYQPEERPERGPEAPIKCPECGHNGAGYWAISD